MLYNCTITLFPTRDFPLTGNWSKEEDFLIEKMRKEGSGWAMIAKNLDGRTDNKVKPKY